MTATIEPTRNADFQTMLGVLQEQQARKIDLVVPAAKLNFKDGQLVLSGLEGIVEEDGVTDPNGKYLPTATFDSGLAERLDIPPVYLRRLREGKYDSSKRQTRAPRLDLYDVNANGLLQGRNEKYRLATGPEIRTYLDPETILTPENELHQDERGTYRKLLAPAIDADTRSFLVRLFRGDNSGEGVARAILSNKFARMDNLDGLMAMLQGIQEAGIDPSTLKISGDLTETRMYVNVQAPEIMALAPKLLENYRSPFDTGIEGTKRQTAGLTMEERIAIGDAFRARGRGDGQHHFYERGNEPIVFAGFKLTNSEVGAGRWLLSPEFTVLQCSNGLTMTRDAFARTHVGSKMDDGHIEWSADTQTKELAWVTSQTKDLVKMALSQEYLEGAIAKLEEGADHVISEPEKAIEVLGKKCSFTKEEQDGILRHFLMGGQGTAAGILNAVTSYSQTVESADQHHDLDAKAVQAFEFAVAMR